MVVKLYIHLHAFELMRIAVWKGAFLVPVFNLYLSLFKSLKENKAKQTKSGWFSTELVN